MDNKQGNAPVNYYRELTRKVKAPSAEELAAMSAHLDNSPVMALSPEAFHELLRLTLDCYAHAKASTTSTATNGHMKRWLEVLDGNLTVTEFHALGYDFWQWFGLASLDMAPIVACCYRRMVLDAQAAFEKLARPDVSQDEIL